jgi:hypothetical protein
VATLDSRADTRPLPFRGLIPFQGRYSRLARWQLAHATATSDT